MVWVQTKNPNLSQFWRVFLWKILVYFMTIWCILLSLEIFIAIWYIFGNLVYFWHVLVFWTKKNLATLVQIETLSTEQFLFGVVHGMWTIQQKMIQFVLNLPTLETKLELIKNIKTEYVGECVLDKCGPLWEPLFVALFSKIFDNFLELIFFITTHTCMSNESPDEAGFHTYYCYRQSRENNTKAFWIEDTCMYECMNVCMYVSMYNIFN
jgi:hypothetical protein